MNYTNERLIFCSLSHAYRNGREQGRFTGTEGAQRRAPPPSKVAERARLLLSPRYTAAVSLTGLIVGYIHVTT